MTDLLIFNLLGPMASWGEEAVGEVRGSASMPTRSAVLGLVGACLGIDRGEEEALMNLERELGLAIRQHSSGVLLRDYHSVQVAEPKKGEAMHTRREELRAERIHTLLSQRDYRVDGAWTAGIWERGGGRGLLERIQSAMLRPGFIPYLGRRACPLSLPLAPKIVAVEDVLDSLEAAPHPLAALDLTMAGGSEELGLLAWERGTPTARTPEREVSRRDGLQSRRRWQFNQRTECQGRPRAGGEA